MKIYIVYEIDEPFSTGDDDGTGRTVKIICAYLSEEKAKRAAKRISKGFCTSGEYKAVNIKDAPDYIIADWGKNTIKK